MTASHAPPGGKPGWLPAGGPSSLTAGSTGPPGVVPGGACKLSPVSNIGESRGKEQGS